MLEQHECDWKIAGFNSGPAGKALMGRDKNRRKLLTLISLSAGKVPLSKALLLNRGVLQVNEAAVDLKQGSKTAASFAPTDQGIKQKYSFFMTALASDSAIPLDF